jgi:hypothetical protein
MAGDLVRGGRVSYVVLHKEVEKVGGVALIVDVRTADRGDLGTAAMEQLVRVIQQDIIESPNGAAFTSALLRMGHPSVPMGGSVPMGRHVITVAGPARSPASTFAIG